MTEKRKYGKEIRTVQRIGGSLMISLPRGYVKAHDVKKGDQIEIDYDTEFRGRLVDTERIKEEFMRRRVSEPKRETKKEVKAGDARESHE